PYNRSIADVHVLVSEDTMLIVNDPMLRRRRDYCAAQAVCGARDIKQNLGSHAHGGSASVAGEALGKGIGLRNVGGNFFSVTGQAFPERPVPRPLPAHLQISLDSLHAEENYVFARPAEGLDDSQCLDGMAKEDGDQISEPEHDALDSRCAAGQWRGEQAHGVGAARIAYRFDVSVFVDIDAG